ncbi:MAG: periplasmic heavy metal sensor [Pseudomonadaceae bacterium]|nr:periplasmic heavy metal sensor [Pseudomonadaceae bacterium]
MKSKWIAILLVTSVALNLLLVGFVVGKRAMPEAGTDPTRVYPRWARTLPEPRRDALRPVVRAHMQAIRPSLRELRLLHRNLRAAIVADPFDATALDDALRALREQDGKVQVVSHNSFIDFVAKLTPAEREQLARDVGRGRPHKGDRHEPRPGFRTNETR